jgi:ribonuclease P protein component
MVKKFGFRKEERLCSAKLIGKLFTGGKSFFHFPVRVVYLILSEEEAKHPVQAAFSVSKKNIRKAADRNLLKRRMKEVYRQNKPVVQQSTEGKGVALIFIYSSPEILPFGDIERAMKFSVYRLARIINSTINNGKGKTAD